MPEMKGFYGAIMVFDNGDKRWDGVWFIISVRILCNFKMLIGDKVEFDFDFFFLKFIEEINKVLFPKF